MGVVGGYGTGHPPAEHTVKAQQRTLPPPPPPRWGLVVNEALLNAIGCPARDWWAIYAARLATNGRSRILTISLIGAIAEYGPWDRDDAEFMRDHMLEQGIHPKALGLRQWTPDLPECVTSGRCRRCGTTHRAPIAEEADHR